MSASREPAEFVSKLKYTKTQRWGRIKLSSYGSDATQAECHAAKTYCSSTACKASRSSVLVGVFLKRNLPSSAVRWWTLFIVVKSEVSEYYTELRCAHNRLRHLFVPL